MTQFAVAAEDEVAGGVRTLERGLKLSMPIDDARMIETHHILCVAPDRFDVDRRCFRSWGEDSDDVEVISVDRPQLVDESGAFVAERAACRPKMDERWAACMHVRLDPVEPLDAVV